MGKPKTIDRKELRRLAGLGLTLDQIAASLGVGRKTLFRHRQEDPTLDDLIEEGRASMIQQVSNALFTAALEGNITAQIFILKARAGWAETQKVEVTSKPAEECTIDELAERLRGRAGVPAASRSH